MTSSVETKEKLKGSNLQKLFASAQLLGMQEQQKKLDRFFYTVAGRTGADR